MNKANAVPNRALDLGINLVETAAVYEDSEEKIGRAIGHRRAEYAVTTKTYQTTRDGAWKDIERSAQALRTDFVDLHQVSDVQDHTALARVLAPDGALAALVEGERARLGPHFCERQGFCQACPEGVGPIEALFYTLGLAQKQGVENLRPSTRKTVASLGLERRTYCGRCEEMCPNRMPIRAAIREARALFGV